MNSIEIFSGAGGLAKGLELAGTTHRAFIEWNANACNTLRRNYDKELVFEGDVRKFSFDAYKDKDGVPVIDTMWFSVVAWEGKNIKDLHKLGAGLPIEVTGRVRSRTYTSSDGEERRIHEVVASKITFIDPETTLAPSMY